MIETRIRMSMKMTIRKKKLEITTNTDTQEERNPKKVAKNILKNIISIERVKE